MNLVKKETELKLFRNINGLKKTWDVDSSRISFRDSNEEIHLRQNQGKAKAKFIKAFLSEDGKRKILKGVD